MNILFLDQFSDLGGAQRCLVDLLPAMRERGWQLHVAAPGNGALRDRALALEASYHQIGSGPYQSGGKSIYDALHFVKELPMLAREIRDLAKQCHARVVYANGPRLLPAACLALRGDCRLVFHCHSYLRQRYAAALAGISLAASRATVIASCRFVAEPLRPFIASNQIEVVYNGVGSVAAPIDRDWPRGRTTRLRIGMIGRIGPEKGQIEFVKAARILKSNYEFVICGAPLFSDATSIRYLEQVRDLAAGLPIEFPGWRDDVRPVLSTLDLLVVPSGPGEATTRVILEAYAAGVPVVASNSGGIPEIVSDGETGFLAPAGDPAKLAARIAEVLKAPAELKRIAENAQRVWRERYTLVRYQGQIISALERIRSQALR